MDAYVDTGVYFFKKESIDKSSVFEFEPKAKVNLNSLLNVEFKELDRDNWKEKEDLKINLNEAENTIFSKLDSINDKLQNHASTARGILAKKEDYKTEFNTVSDKKIFIGNINRYKLEEDYLYIEYGNNLKEKPNNYDFFKGERILVRRIVNRQFRLMATMTDKEFICKKDIYIIKLNNDSLNIKFILGLLNSKLFSYYKTKNSGSAKKDDFTQITLSDIRQFPLPKATKNQMNKVCKLVSNQILAYSDNGKIDITIDKKIDHLVYQLYDLTEEEIKIIENA